MRQLFDSVMVYAGDTDRNLGPTHTQRQHTFRLLSRAACLRRRCQESKSPNDFAFYHANAMSNAIAAGASRLRDIQRLP